MEEYESVKKSLSPPWSLIESNPEIFTSMLRMYGVKSLETREIFDMDELNTIGEQVYGVIFSSALTETQPAIEAEDPEIESMFFSCQIIANICATSALLGVILNIQDKEIEVSDKLLEFKEFTKDFNSVDRGLAISNSEFLKETHNTFGTLESKITALHYPEYSDIYTTRKSKKRRLQPETNYHYTAFIPFGDGVWELDGYNKTPVKCGLKGADGWLKKVHDVIKSRMEKTGTLEFNILLVTKSQQSTSLPSAVPTLTSVSKTAAPISTEYKFFETLLSRSSKFLVSKSSDNKQTDTFESIYADILKNAKTLKEDEHDKYITKAFKKIELASLHHGMSMLQNVARLELKQTAANQSKVSSKETSKVDSIDDATNMFIERSRHDYIPFINALFKKLNERDLLKNIHEEQ